LLRRGFALGFGRSPGLHQLVDVPALLTRDHAADVLLYHCHARRDRADLSPDVAPGLPHQLLALLECALSRVERLLAVSKLGDGNVEALQVGQVFNLPTLLFRQSGKRRKGAVDLAHNVTLQPHQAWPARRLRARRNLALGPMVGVDRVSERRKLR
jgi:hypothetical protein